MSSRHLLVLTALASLLIVQRGQDAASQTPPPSLADLVLQDQINILDTRLKSLPKTAETVAFQGEVEFRRGHFEEAEKLYRSALQISEKTARAHFGLGKLAMARVKVPDAVKSFNRAIELDGKEPLYRFYVSDALALQKKSKEAEQQLQEYLRLNPKDPDRVPMARAALDITAAYRGIEIGQVDAPAQPAPIRVQAFLNLLFTDVLINGQGPFRFMIDTGATQTVLSEKLATRLGLKKIASNVMHGVGGEGKLESPIYRTDTLKIGDVTVKNLPLGALSNPLLDQVLDGIIGTSMLSDFVITIDYAKSRIELARQGSSEGTAIPVWYFSGLLLVPVEVNGQSKGNFLIDTGADSTLLAHSMAGALGINKNTPGAKLNLPVGGVGGLDSEVLLVPDVFLKTPFASKHFDALAAIDLQSMSSLIQTELSGVLGYDSLKDYRVTIDYNKAEIRLSK